jgi:hypothetical protein
VAGGPGTKDHVHSRLATSNELALADARQWPDREVVRRAATALSGRASKQNGVFEASAATVVGAMVRRGPDDGSG